MGKTKQVVIGNSAAGLAAVKAIREVDRACPVTLISAEDCNAYSPVLLTYYLANQISKEDLFVVDDDFYKQHQVNLIFGVKAINLDASAQRVLLEDSSQVEYDKLLIATGASAIRLDGTGDKAGHVFTLRDIKDAEKIMKCGRKAKEAIIVGAGLIGLQTADALFRKGINCTIVERANQVFPENVDRECAGIIQKTIESHGVPTFLGQKVSSIESKADRVTVTSVSGEEWVGDMVVVGVGLKPNNQLVQSSAVKVNMGIVVDDFMRTSVSNVYAAGDVSEGVNLVSGGKEVIPTWSNACRQGRIAGLNMAGRPQRYEGGLRETITTVFGMTLASVGLCRADGNEGVEELVLSDLERKVYRKLLLAGNRLAGAIMLSGTRDAGPIGNLIRNRVDITFWKDSFLKLPMDLRSRFLPVREKSQFAGYCLNGGIR
jgi:NAD(P)H-nitrite reductase large subunit